MDLKPCQGSFRLYGGFRACVAASAVAHTSFHDGKNRGLELTALGL